MPTKQEILKSAALIWIMASIVYIGYDVWSDYKIRGIQAAYQQGVNDSLKQLFEKTQTAECKKTIEVNLGENKLELVDAKCLQQQASATDGPASATDGPATAPSATKK